MRVAHFYGVISKVVISIAVLLSVFDALAQDKYIEKKGNVEIHRNPNSSSHEIQKLVFVDSLTGLKKEFDVKENNPYQSLEYPEIGRTGRGEKIFELNKDQMVAFFEVDQADLYGQGFSISSHPYVETSGGHASVSYNLYSYTDEGEETGLRKTSLVVLDRSGSEIYSKGLDSDAYNVRVSPNGKYLGYTYGETSHDFEPDYSGYTIINLENRSTEINIPIRSIEYSSRKYCYLLVRGWDNSDSFRYTWIFNTNTSDLFKVPGLCMIRSEDLFRIDGPTSIEIDDLSRYLVK